MPDNAVCRILQLICLTIELRSTGRSSIGEEEISHFTATQVLASLITINPQVPLTRATLDKDKVELARLKMIA